MKKFIIVVGYVLVLLAGYYAGVNLDICEQTNTCDPDKT